MREDLEAFAASLLDELCRRWPLGYVPDIRWRNLRVTAGLAHYDTRSISLSRIVLIDEARVKDTLIHEYAHLLTVKRFGLKAGGHGPHWRAVMHELGQAPTVAHRYEVKRNSTRQQVSYLCLRCGAKFQRARRLPARRQYVHATCGGRLRLHEVAKREVA